MIDWAGWLVSGITATALLTAVLVTAQLRGWTRLDLPLLLGTIVVADPDRARVIGSLLHLAAGQAFALGYAVVFARHGSPLLLGAALGLLHGAVAVGGIVPLLPGVHPRMASERAGLSTAAVLEPPGLLAVNYGVATPVLTLLAHVGYGVLLAALL